MLGVWGDKGEPGGLPQSAAPAPSRTVRTFSEKLYMRISRIYLSSLNTDLTSSPDTEASISLCE
uniref:Uncharacterized protein n=1 Tax=Malurus cyaneus samueli TaxID=2593467 RepID=A0A8C5T2S0_9PASS